MTICFAKEKEIMTVKDLMTANVRSVKPDAAADVAAELMRSENIGLVPVCDSQNHLLGVITDRDLVIRKSHGKTAAEVMTQDVQTVTSRMNIHDAALLFSRFGVRRLPVIDDGRLVGILSLKDLARKKIFMAELGHIIYDISNLD